MLAEHGIAPVLDAPGVGRNLQDHYIARLTFRLTDHRWSANRRIVWPRLAWEVLRWATTGKGVLTWSPGMMSLFARTQDGLEAPDVQINGGPISWQDGRIGVPETEPGFTLGVWQCRPHSRGTRDAEIPARGGRAGDRPALPDRTRRRGLRGARHAPGAALDGGGTAARDRRARGPAGAGCRDRRRAAGLREGDRRDGVSPVLHGADGRGSRRAARCAAAAARHRRAARGRCLGLPGHPGVQHQRDGAVRRGEGRRPDREDMRG